MTDGLLLCAEGVVGDPGVSAIAIADREALTQAFSGNHGPGAIRIPPDVPLDALLPILPRLDRVEVVFSDPGDGRGLTLGKRMRRAGFAGRLRAVGPVIADQFADILACGFDEVHIPDSVAARQPLAEWMGRLRAGTLSYQTGNGAKLSILGARWPGGSGKGDGGRG